MNGGAALPATPNPPNGQQQTTEGPPHGGKVLFYGTLLSLIFVFISIDANCAHVLL